MHAYFNYPNKHVTLHATGCGRVQQEHKINQRRIHLTFDALGEELQRFVKQEHAFASQAANNDMWLEFDFGDREFEEAVVAFIQRLLGQRYSAFRNCKPEWHCR